MTKDLISGAVLLVLAAAYYWATLQIPDSRLADEVGAQGLPVILTILLAGLAALLMVRALVLRPARRAAQDDGEPQAGIGRALGLLAIGGGYMLLAPLAGYAPAVGLLIVAVALYEGMRPSWRMAAVAIAGGIGFWLLFVWLLGVEQPSSLFLS